MNKNKTYEVTYRIPFIVSQQKMNSNFIKLHKKIIQLKPGLHKRSLEYLVSKEHNVEAKTVDKSVNDILSNVMNKVSKRNIEALGKVQFSARIDFSADGGLRIAEIENINSIEPVKLDSYVESELDPLLCKMRTTKKTTVNLPFFRSKRDLYA